MISIIIPVYKSGKTLLELHEKLKKELSTIKNEIIFVDDCSNDESWNIIKQIFKNNENIKAYKLSKNFGQHAALLCGIRKASGEIIVTMDDDYQHPPEKIKLLLDKISDECHVVYGTPLKQNRSIFRNITSQIIKLLISFLTGKKHIRQISSFRAFKTTLRDNFSNFKGTDVHIDTLLNWTTEKFGYVLLEHNQRKYSKSNYSFTKLYDTALTMISNYGVSPLRIASLLGILFSFLGFLLLFYILGEYFISGEKVRGFVFVASIIIIFSGAQLFIMGIFGEYLTKILRKNDNQPPYKIEEKIEKI